MNEAQASKRFGYSGRYQQCMAGLVFGRIIKAKLAAGFVSANLLMLHKRRVDDLGQSEYRSGVEHESEKVGLSDEFERQFYGDVMLFSME